MISDARSWASGEIIEADLCVIGSGPAGLSLAHELEGTGLRVLVMETGGLNEAPDRNALSDLDGSSRFGAEKRIENTRRFGGNANVWCVATDVGYRNVRMIPYSRADFAARESIGSPGWPIDYDLYMDWIRRAQEHLALSGSFLAAGRKDLAAPAFDLPAKGIETHVFQFPNAEAYLERAHRRLETSRNVHLVTYAHALELIPDASDGAIAEVLGASEPGREFTIRAKRFVLAGGGLAVPQLMLSSQRRSAAGIGNMHDTVGRWFMDHPLVDGGDLIPASRSLFDRAELYDLRTVSSGSFMGFLAPSDEALMDHPMANINLILFPSEKDFRRHRELSHRQSLGFYSAVRVRDALRHRHRPLVRDLVGALAGADGVVRKAVDATIHPRSNLARGGWSRLDRPSARFDVFEVVHLAEQAPRRDNRVSLGNERDRFGRRRVKVDWRFSEEDQQRLVRAQEYLAGRIEASGLGRWAVRRVGGRPDIKSDSTGHFLGATRMHVDPRQGVTTPDCRVHGVENLFIASSSVFPTGGYANPTLSIMALAIGLADRLKAS